MAGRIEAGRIEAGRMEAGRIKAGRIEAGRIAIQQPKGASFGGGPSQTAAPEHLKSVYEIAGHLGECVARAGASRWGGGCLKGLVVAGSCSQRAAPK